MTDTDVLAGQMLEASKDTREAIRQLSSALNEHRDERRDELAEIKADIAHLTTILVGEQGDNGITSRVLLLESQRGSVRWESVGVLVALALAGLGYLMAAGGW